MKASTLLTIVVLAFVNRVEAAFIQNSFGLNNPQQTITFSEFPTLAQYSAFGLSFSGMTYNPVPAQSYPHISAPDIGNFGNSGFGTNPFSIFFSSPQTDVAFALISQMGSTSFEARLAGVTVGSASVVTNNTNTNNFYGFTGVTFNEIRMSTLSPDRAGLIDNLQIVPEPTSMLLFGLGSLLIVARRAHRNHLSAQLLCRVSSVISSVRVS